jgi:hypothetical protein
MVDKRSSAGLINLLRQQFDMDTDSNISRYYLGTVQVRLRNISYSSSSTEPDNCSGCCISDLEHNLPALITYSEYQQSLIDSAIAECTLYQVGQPPRLVLPTSSELPCLHGRFRIESAKKDDSDRLNEWWIVDLYITGKDRWTVFDSLLTRNRVARSHKDSTSRTVWKALAYK